MTLSATPGLWEEFSKLHGEFLQGVYSGDKPSICGLDSHQPEFRPPNDPSNKEQHYSVCWGRPMRSAALSSISAMTGFHRSWRTGSIFTGHRSEEKQYEPKSLLRIQYAV